MNPEAAARATGLRRKAVIAAAFCAILGGVVPLGLHGHRWIAFVAIGAQFVLLVTALSLYTRSNKAAATK